MDILLNNIQKASKEEIELHSKNLFKKTIQLLKQNTFYKEKLKHFDSSNFFLDESISSISSEEIVNISFKNYHQNNNSNRLGVAVRSGGTTGESKVIIHSWDFNERVIQLGVRGIESAFNSKPTAIANCFSSGNLRGAFYFLECISQRLGLRYFPIGSGLNMDEVADLIWKYKIDTLCGTPTYLSTLISNIRNPEKFSSVNKILYVGELFPDHEENIVKSIIPEVKIKSLSYSSAETGPVGYQCTHLDKSFHHLNDDAVHVEILNIDSDIKMPKEEVGEIVVTTYLNSGVPLLRYRTGDLGIIHEKLCGCGTFTQVLQLLGRKSTSVNVCGTLITKKMILDVFNKEEELIKDTDIQFLVFSSKRKRRVTIFINEEKCSNDRLSVIKELMFKQYKFKHIKNYPGTEYFNLELIRKERFHISDGGKTPFFVIKNEKIQ